MKKVHLLAVATVLSATFVGGRFANAAGTGLCGVAGHASVATPGNFNRSSDQSYSGGNSNFSHVGSIGASSVSSLASVASTYQNGTLPASTRKTPIGGRLTGPANITSSLRVHPPALSSVMHVPESLGSTGG